MVHIYKGKSSTEVNVEHYQGQIQDFHFQFNSISIYMYSGTSL